MPGSAPRRAPDWPVEPVLDWLVREARLLGDLRLVVDGLCQRLAQAGAPLWRFYLGLQTLHPQLRAMAYVWTRGTPTQEIARRHGIERTSAFIGSPIQQVRLGGRKLRHRLAVLTDADHAVLHELRAEGGTDYLAWPMPFSRGEVPVVTLASEAAEGFSDADIAKLERALDHLAPIAEAQLMHRIAVTLLQTYLGVHTGQRILDGLVRRGDGETIRAVLWFSDMRNFTGLSEALPPQRTLAMLNRYFEVLDAALRPRGGEILRFIGDGVLAIFPVADAMFLPQACSGALDAALDAIERMRGVNASRQAEGEPEIRFGVGLHVGSFTYGNIGTEDRLDFTVIGPAVNRCARLEALSKALGVPIVTSGEFNANCPRPLRSLGFQELRGVDGKQEVFTATA
ncbi:MAG: adenylate/guanylate cyclase domain-containing protein [Reyranellaceae bacterium]